MNAPVRPLALLLLLAPAALGAQAFDRSHPPSLGRPADLRLPPVQQTTLPNGIAIRLVEMHEVPLVQVNLRVAAGARLDGDLAGLATFTADMLDEGAAGRDAAAIAAAAASLGADLSVGAGWDVAAVTVSAPKRTLGPALDLLADVALRPEFHAADVMRERELRLADILQSRDEPRAMANLAFSALLYPPAHPYHRPIGGDSASTARLDSATVRGFYARSYRPDQATFVVTGDITLAEARALIAARFGGWRADRMAAPHPAVPRAVGRPASRTIYLVHKPEAAQSVIMIGAPGVDRSSPDYAAIEVMNTILGGSFSSRLNQNLRETKGYTYGAGSQFVYRPVPGPFVASAAVRTDVTDSSLVEFFKELNAIRDAPVSAVELDRARNYLALGLPGDFETTGQMAGKIGEMITFGLPAGYYNGFVRRVLAVSAADVQRVARRYMDPARVAVVVVGDSARIRAGIEALGLGPLVPARLDGVPAQP